MSYRTSRRVEEEEWIFARLGRPADVPGDTDDDDASQQANPAFVRRPRLVVYCETLGDVRRSLEFAATSRSGRPSGRSLGRCAMPEQGTLLAASLFAGHATAFAPPSVAEDRVKLRFLLVLYEINLECAGNAILISLPRLRVSSADGLVVRMSGATAACGSSDVPMNSLDIVPTVCGLTGVPGSPAFVGRDYSALVPGVRA